MIDGGKLLSTTGSLAETFGAEQPFRYRGYVYDEETGWYYLQSRYYNPELGRFISADVYLSTGQGVLGHNAYAYCLNNPVNMSDGCGCIAMFVISHSVDYVPEDDRYTDYVNYVEINEEYEDYRFPGFTLAYGSYTRQVTRANSSINKLLMLYSTVSFDDYETVSYAVGCNAAFYEKNSVGVEVGTTGLNFHVTFGNFSAGFTRSINNICLSIMVDSDTDVCSGGFGIKISSRPISIEGFAVSFSVCLIIALMQQQQAYVAPAKPQLAF